MPAKALFFVPQRDRGDFHFAWMKVPLTRIMFLILANILLGDSCLDCVRRYVPCASSMLMFSFFQQGIAAISTSPGWKFH